MIRNILLTVLVMLLPVLAKAQFKVVDAESKETLPGVFVFSESGKLLAMSDENGVVPALNEKVTLSMMTYESKTIDANGFTGEVALSTKPFELGEVVVGRTEFLKISATFRDFEMNFDNVVMYREGIVDYYIDMKTKKSTRRIRGCRQYEVPDLHTALNDSIFFTAVRLLDFNKLEALKTGGQTVKGDTVLIEASTKKKTVKDGVMTIEKDGLYRVIIDNLKFTNRTSVNVLGIREKITKNIVDWIYSDKERDISDLVAMRMYYEMECKWSSKKVTVPVQVQQDFVVNSVTCLKKAEAKEEMKEKEISKEFTLPDCLPAIPQSIVEQGKKLILKKYKEI